MFGEEWKQLSDEKKAPYIAKYKEEFKNYALKISEWEAEMVRQGKESWIRVSSKQFFRTV